MVVFLNEDVLLEILYWFVSVDEDGPFTLFFLSTKWREVLLRSPRLWAWITVNAGSADWRERFHTSLMMSTSVPIYLTLKNPFPDLSTFGPTHFERARHLTIDAPNGAYQHQNFLALLRRGYFGNVQQVQYLQNGISAACIANPSRVWLWGHHNHVWLVPESMQKVARVSPIRAVNRFDFEIDSARSHFLESADIFFASVMNKYLHISVLVVIGDDLMELMKSFQEPHKLVFPYLQALVYKRRSFKGVIHPLDRRVKPVLFIFAPALEWMSVEDTFDRPADGFRVLQLESSHPVGMNFTMRGPLRMDADISVLQSRCLHSVATINLNLLRISAPLNPQQESDHSSVLKAIKKSLDGVIVQMPRLSFVRVLVRHNMVDLLEALLPLPQSITKRKIWWKIEISNGMQSRHLDPMNPPAGIDIDRLVLQARKLPWTKLPQTRALYVDSIVDVNIFLAAIYPPLNELKIGLQVQKLSKAQVLDNMVSLYDLTTLHSPVWFALKVLQSRSVPLLKRLILLIHDSDSKEPRSPIARAERRQEVDYVLEQLGEYKEVSLEMIQFPFFPTWMTLCNLINSRYSEPGLQLALKVYELPCLVILRSLAAAFRGEYAFTGDSICQDHENGTGFVGSGRDGEMPVHLTRDNIINY